MLYSVETVTEAFWVETVTEAFWVETVTEAFWVETVTEAFWVETVTEAFWALFFCLHPDGKGKCEGKSWGGFQSQLNIDGFMLAQL